MTVAPSTTKIILKPKTKPMELNSSLLFTDEAAPPSSEVVPDKYTKYIGSIGNMHGEIKVKIPSIKVIKYVIALM